MKILYIGHYKENSGWSQAAIDNILALDSCGIDVVCRNFTLTQDNNFNVPSRIIELESKSVEGATHCIQHVLPHHIVGTDMYTKNVAYYVHETDSIKDHIWKHYLSLVDEVWVPNSDNAQALREAGLKSVKIVPHTFNTDVYTQDYAPVNIAPGTFKFYYIGDFDTRKNLKSVIKSFYSEFRYDEPVSLILKIKKNHDKYNTLDKEFSDYITNIKQNLRIYPNVTSYNKEIVISEDLTRENILRLHKTCDCFVNTSHGEGWSIPSFEAMCFGNTPICTNFAGPKDFIDKDDINTGSLINGCWSICDHPSPPFKEIWSGHECWMIPDEKQIRASMRFYYENRSSIDKKAGLIRGQNFSYNKIGNLMKETLSNE